MSRCITRAFFTRPSRGTGINAGLLDRRNLLQGFLRAPAWAALIAAQHPDPLRRARVAEEAAAAMERVDLDAPATSGLLPLALALD